MNTGESVLRTFRDGDESAVLRLLSDVGAACSLEDWAWHFPANERGRPIVIGERGGEVTSVCAAAEVTLTIDGREHPGVEILRLASTKRDKVSAVLEHFIDIFGAGRHDAIILASLGAGAKEPARFTVTRSGQFAVLVRRSSFQSSSGRLCYRAESARDWEPRLDGLWQRARDAYPVAVVRDADHALRRFAGHPTIRHHRFLVFPRFSSRAVAFAVFALVGDQLRWLDLVWDHDHPGALGLLAHISGRLVVQFRAAGEELWLAGDEMATAILTNVGFVRDQSTTLPRIAARAPVSAVDASRFVEGAYLTTADATSPLG